MGKPEYLIFEGKKYVSSKTASELTGYNSDYVGQLSRAGKIDSRKVGRAWFVSEESLLEHKREMEALSSSASKSSDSGEKSVEVKVKKEEPKLFFSYAHEESSPVPELAPKQTGGEVRKSPFVVEIAKNQIASTPKTPREKNSVLYESPERALGSMPFLRTAVASFVILLLLSGVGMAASKSSSGSPFAAIRQANDFAWNASKNGAEHLSLYLEDKLPNEEKLTAASYGGAGGVFEYVWQRVLLGAHTISVAMFDLFGGDTDNHLVANDKNIAQRPSASGNVREISGPTEGVIVETKEELSAEDQVSRLKNSFSDDIEIVEVDDRSGVITPVFKEGPGDEYIYVLVPVKDK